MDQTDDSIGLFESFLHFFFVSGRTTGIFFLLSSPSQIYRALSLLKRLALVRCWARNFQ